MGARYKDAVHFLTDTCLLFNFTLNMEEPFTSINNLP